MFFGLSCLIGFIMIFFAIGIILSKNPVYTVLSFILIIVCISIYLIGFLQNEFLGLVLLIVYAGAIAVLFLFVVMMLNIRLIELTKLFWGYLPFGLLFSFLFSFEIFIFFFWKISLINFFYSYLFIEKLNYFFFYNNIITYFYFVETIINLSYLFYNYYYFQLILISILLLVAMIGVIILTFKDLTIIIMKQQDIFKQVEKTIYTSIKKINEINNE